MTHADLQIFQHLRSMLFKQILKLLAVHVQEIGNKGGPYNYTCKYSSGH